MTDRALFEVDAVEAFRSKCESTDIHSGIIVSGKGFAKTAIKKARGYNIECLTLDQVESFDWCHAPGIFVRNRTMTGSHMYIEFPDGTDLSGTVVGEDGNPFLKERVGPIALQHLQTNPEQLPNDVGDHAVRIHDLNPALYMAHREKRVRATKLILSIQYAVKRRHSLFEFRKYVDQGQSRAIGSRPPSRPSLSAIGWAASFSPRERIGPSPFRSSPGRRSILSPLLRNHDLSARSLDGAKRHPGAWSMPMAGSRFFSSPMWSRCPVPRCGWCSPA